jgi:hypothetical protein
MIQTEVQPDSRKSEQKGFGDEIMNESQQSGR